jgi:hypothetical protein
MSSDHAVEFEPGTLVALNRDVIVPVYSNGRLSTRSIRRDTPCVVLSANAVAQKYDELFIIRYTVFIGGNIVDLLDFYLSACAV